MSHSNQKSRFSKFVGGGFSLIFIVVNLLIVVFAILAATCTSRFA